MVQKTINIALFFLVLLSGKQVPLKRSRACNRCNRYKIMMKFLETLLLLVMILYFSV